MDSNCKLNIIPFLLFAAVKLVSNLLSFYDNTLTANNETTIVTCCGISLSPQNVSCGRGVSCSGQCSAKDASLCPSGMCDQCEQGIQLEEEQITERRFAPVTLPSWALAHCPRLCYSPNARRVLTRYWPLCCYHPICKAMSVVRSKCVNHAVYLGRWPNPNFYSFLCRPVLSPSWQPPSWGVDLLWAASAASYYSNQWHYCNLSW